MKSFAQVKLSRNRFMLPHSGGMEVHMKRQDYISWDEYFMGLALLSAKRSKDPGTQVGACIVGSDKRVLTIGYNGLPAGCSDDEFPWEREGDPLDTKYFYVCHAEMNAILNSGHSDLRGSIVYTTLFPCADCTKAIIQKGISEVVYLSDKYAQEDLFVAAKKMMKSAGVLFRPYLPTNKQITLEV